MPGKTRRFSYYWGSGVVAEEARTQGEHHVPAIQLLVYDEGEAAGTTQVRFCHYDHKGRFQRSPLLVGETEILALRESLLATPTLRALLRKLVE